jgi:hypothetical protein
VHPKDQQFLETLGARLGDRFQYIGPEIERRFGALLNRDGGPDAIATYVVHHSAGDADIYGIWAYHRHTLGWDTGGYNLAVDRDGAVRLVALPSQMTYGAGARWNPVTLHVVCQGNFHPSDTLTVHQPTPALLQSLYTVLCVCDDTLAYRPWRGHREIRQTSCPGDHLFPHVRTMRGADYGAREPAAARPATYP